MHHGSPKGVHEKKKNQPRVNCFFSTIYLGLTLLCNQAHVYIRKYDNINAGTFLLLLAQMPRKLHKAISAALFPTQHN